MNSGARGADGVVSQRWTSEAVAARFAELAADLALSLNERDALAAHAREREAEARASQLELERLRARILEYEAIIHGMKKRRTWRFTAPLRVLHDWWRRRRRERRAKKRAAAAARREGGPSFG